jgi:hypothetical protein
MKAFAAIASLVLVAFVILLWQWRTGRGSAQFVLAVVPFGLLFVLVPIPLSAVMMIRGFQAMAAAGHGGVKEAVTLALGIARPLWLGSIAFLVAMSIAAGLQMLASRLDRQPKGASANSDGARTAWGNWVLIASPLLVVPVAILSYLMQAVATLTVRGSIELTRSVEAQDIAPGMNPAELSEIISSRLVLAGFVGFPLILAVLVFGVGTLFAARFSRSSDRLARYSWAVFAVVCIVTVWHLIGLAASIRSFDRALH